MADIISKIKNFKSLSSMLEQTKDYPMPNILLRMRRAQLEQMMGRRIVASLHLTPRLQAIAMEIIRLNFKVEFPGNKTEEEKDLDRSRVQLLNTIYNVIYWMQVENHPQFHLIFHARAHQCENWEVYFTIRRKQ